MNPFMSARCRCGEETLPYMTNVVIDDTGGHHRTTVCSNTRIELLPEPEPPASWRLVNAVCSHSEALWVTGPDPDGLLAELGCGCAA